MTEILEKLHTEDLLENKKEILYSLLDDEKLRFLSENMPSFFEYSKQLNNTAYLSWKFNFSHETSNDFNIMADAYYECVIELIEKCVQNNVDRKLDTWIFPILYNIGHSIELKLKAICLYQKNGLSTNHKWIELTENLKQFYTDQNLKDEISLQKKRINEQFIISLEIVKKFLEKFLSKSSDVTFTRYPIDTKNNDFFYNNSENNVVIDLILLRNEFILSYYLLDFIVEMSAEESSNIN